MGISAGTGMVSKKKSGSKQKKSDGELSKRQPAKQPESGDERVAQVEEEHGRVDSTSPSLKIIKSGSDKEDEEEQEEEAEELLVENKKSGQTVVEGSSGSGKPLPGKARDAMSGKGKRLKSEIDELKVESPSLTSAGSPAARQLRPRKQPAVFQEVSREESNDALLSSIIGKKIQVYWPLDKKWYSGQVRSFDAKTNRHLVVYDDGEQERLELKKERIKIQVEPRQVFGETAEVRAALPEGDKDIDTKESKGDSNKNSVKCKEEDGIVDGGKKSGVKRKQGKKNDRKIKDEEIETAGKKVEMEVEMMGTDVDDSKKKNEEDEENVNKSNLGKEDEGQEQLAEEVHNHKKPKKLKQTAPRTKRGIGKQIVQERVVEDGAESGDRNQESKEQSHHTVQNIKADDDDKATDHTSLEEVRGVEVGSAANTEGEKQQKAKESGKLPRKKADGSVTGSPDKLADSDEEMDAKRLSKDAGKQPNHTEKFDEKKASTVVTEQHIDDQKPVEQQVLEHADEDELTVDSGDRPKMANQMEEKRIDTRGGDGKVTEKKIETKVTDQASKKHTNKKHHGRTKAREPGKK